jgi:hyperosmotically inducible periplasmic protein
MRTNSDNTCRFFLWASSFAIGAFGPLFIATPTLAHQSPQQPDSYSSSTPVPNPTPDPSDQSKMTPSDRAISQKIKRALASDKSLSADGRRVKVWAQAGKVTLQGSVPSSPERTAVVSKATAIAGQGNVTDKIEVTPSKQ